ncbi:MAG: NADPH-dependent 2,4-dienoyl-CoA reductase, partial [Boseongicola sp.]|nr:NADPH-dependent 2,4-dienoyl-CoA reductase [Boseongicola sp.]
EHVRIDDNGLHINTADGPAVIACDTVVLCAGQEPDRSLLTVLEGGSSTVHVIGGADVAAELDAKRAIDQGARLAATV